jgi:hypothetical protein
MTNKVNIKVALATAAAYEIAMKSLKMHAEDLLTQAVDQAPKKEGNLRRSGLVKEIDGKIYVTFNTPYARRQHEEVGWHHNIGKAKYLEDPYKLNKTKIKKGVLEEVKKKLKEMG